MAQQMAALHPQVHWWCPQLPPSPRDAMALLMQGVKDWPPESMAVVGSSLGGFYAAWIAEKTGCQAVLLNPAVNPARDLEKYIGEQTLWNNPDEHFFFRREFIQELVAIQSAPPTQPGHYLALITQGDEVLDWHEAHAHYAGAHRHLIEGGDHAISDFEAYLPEIMAFLGLR